MMIPIEESLAIQLIGNPTLFHRMVRRGYLRPVVRLRNHRAYLLSDLLALRRKIRLGFVVPARYRKAATYTVTEFVPYIATPKLRHREQHRATLKFSNPPNAE